MIRRVAKAAVCHALARARLERCLERRRPVVLAYHRVVDDAALDGLMPGIAVGVRMLERHLDWVGRRFRFVTLDELAAAPPDRAGLCALTFDDGYRDVLQHALPLLLAKGIPAALFVVSGAVGSRAPLLHERLHRALARRATAGDDAYAATRRLIATVEPRRLAAVVDRLEREAGGATAVDDGALPLGWEELARLRAAGMTIGSHTRTHAPLVRLGAEQLAEETLGARRELEAGLGVPVRHFAYPDGQFDGAAIAAVAAAGYQLAFTCCRHRDPAHPRLTVPRVMLWHRSSLGALGRFSGDVLSCQTGALPFLDPCRRRHAGVRA
jgi:peptidoglycan/xylan/chitin deacetylase (PgdA/CDA1 family)